MILACSRAPQPPITVINPAHSSFDHLVGVSEQDREAERLRRPRLITVSSTPPSEARQ
jgi:hypothetical protein